ncbi:hypothetical protein O6H91_10G090200 [Diphasiastrum complanatum]|uniref:Uncharacterized protein n=1 Tax=Diphasiastrum complanatum TaxID=34168 RepID=A0ACC2CJF3_DIPCM|nr:hypothetical protein O6H91_10G090200 [Diphasiastrum complanatum]
MAAWLLIIILVPCLWLPLFLLWRRSNINVSRFTVGEAKLIPPRGNWCIPFVGENLQFLLNSPDSFFRKRSLRYGNMFRTEIFGSQTVVTSTPEQAKQILAIRHKSFRPFYPPSIGILLNHPSWEGSFHQRVRKIIQAPLLAEALQNRMAKLDRITMWVLDSWESKSYVITHDETRKIAFHVALDIACGLSPGSESMRLLDGYGYVAEGAMYIPICIPGSTFSKAVQKSKYILERLSELVADRRAQKYDLMDDVLSSLMESKDENGLTLSDQEIRDILLVFLFAGHETTSAFLVWIVKYLAENQEILENVKKEHNIIRENKKSDEEPLDWLDVQNMPLTLRVVQETLRLANVVAFSPRESCENVEIDGHLIPKGWKVQVYYRHFHLSPKHYKDPLKFDPSRFEVPPPAGIYMPFGNGTRLCPGADLVKLEALIFVHRLVTNYRWEVVAPDSGTKYWLCAKPRDGLKIKVKSLHHPRNMADLNNAYEPSRC